MRVLSSAVCLWLPVLAALLVAGCSPYDSSLLGGTGGGGTGGGGTGGAGTGGGGTGGECVPTSAVEDCDMDDDDCMGGLNNGAANDSCLATILNATPRCSSSGSCLIASCNRGFANCNGQPSDGCEPCSECPPTTAACMNLDLDGGSDDAGAEDAAMSLPDGAVTDAATDAGTDSGGACTPTNGGTERCDGVDNDCDGTVDQATTCPTNCTGHTLPTGVYASCNAATFGSARTTCTATALGMHLVRIDSVEENAAVLALNPSAIWIGASDSDSLSAEGAWEWHDGAQFWMGGPASMGGVAVGGLYANWGTGQPDNAGSGGEDCAEMTTAGTWNDLRCDSSRRFVCEL